MIALYIIAAVIGVIAILFMCRIYLVVSYRDGEDDALSLSVRYTFWRMRLVPSPGGKIKLGDYTYKKTHKKKEEKKPKKKTDRKKTDKKTKKAPPKQADKPHDEKPAKNALLLLLEMRGMIFDLLKRLPRKFRLEIKRLHIVVGADDAAATAITYGTVTQAAGAALTLAEEHADVRIKRGCVMITPDFLSGKISADVKARLSVRVGSLVGLALCFLFGFVKLKMSRSKG